MIVKKKLGEMLVESKLLTEEQLTQALAEQKKAGLKLGQYICRQGILSDNKIVDVLSRQLKIEKYHPDGYSIDMEGDNIKIVHLESDRNLSNALARLWLWWVEQKEVNA